MCTDCCVHYTVCIMHKPTMDYLQNATSFYLTKFYSKYRYKGPIRGLDEKK